MLLITFEHGWHVNWKQQTSCARMNSKSRDERKRSKRKEQNSAVHFLGNRDNVFKGMHGTAQRSGSWRAGKQKHSDCH